MSFDPYLGESSPTRPTSASPSLPCMAAISAHGADDGIEGPLYPGKQQRKAGAVPGNVQQTS